MARRALPGYDARDFPEAEKEELLYVYTAAVALCMVGREKPENIKKVVRELSANPAARACEHSLVKRGVRVHAICPFDMKAFANAEDGLAFMRAYYRQRGVWTNKWETYWADEAPRSQRAVKEGLQLLRSKRNYSVEMREPEIEDVTAALDGTQVVSILLRPYGTKRTELGAHPVILYEWQPKQRQFLSYDPDCSFVDRVVGLSELRTHWLREEGVIFYPTELAAHHMDDVPVLI